MSPPTCSLEDPRRLLADWHERAKCVGQADVVDPPALTPGVLAKARKLCGACEVAEQCLADALEGPAEEDLTGMRGGKTPRERAALRYAAETKHCPACGVDKSILDFSPVGGGFGRRGYCKPCNAARTKAERARKKEAAGNGR